MQPEGWAEFTFRHYGILAVNHKNAFFDFHSFHQLEKYGNRIKPKLTVSRP
jgi:hypothetical protein